MQKLASSHETIANLIEGQTVDYLDIPCHENIGDLLIFLGTLKFLSRADKNIRIMRPAFGYRPPATATSDRTTILFHGGGNVGDLYPSHQKFREHIIVRHLKRRIIIMPQTVFFRTSAGLESAQRSFRAHPDLHIFVRDRESLRIALTLSPNVSLMPDMAHQLFPIFPPETPRLKPNLDLYRTDIESASGSYHNRHGRDGRTIDWSDIVPTNQIALRKTLRLIGRAGSEFATDLLVKRMEISAASLARTAVELFSQYDHVSTDRLHGHILACLMSIPSTTANNSYGKNFSYIDTWTGQSPIVDKFLE